MKILNLVIYTSRIKIYEDFYKIISPFYKSQNDTVDTYFVEYSEDLDVPYKINGDQLTIQGRECMIPGLLWKIIDALLILKHDVKKYDYILRTNASTLVDFKTLDGILKSENMDYFGGCIYHQGVLDPNNGIVDKNYIGTKFVSGTMIGMSKNFCEFLLDNRHKIDHHVVDDVAIGIFFKNYGQGWKGRAFPNRFIFLGGEIHTIEWLTEVINNKKPIAWRNKSDNRAIDLINMKNVAKLLSAR